MSSKCVLYYTPEDRQKNVQSGSQAFGLRYIYEKQKIPQSRQISQSSFPKSVKLTEIKEGHPTGKLKVGHDYQYAALEIGVWKTYMDCNVYILYLAEGMINQNFHLYKPRVIQDCIQADWRFQLSLLRFIAQAVNKMTPGFRPLSVCRQ